MALSGVLCGWRRRYTPPFPFFFLSSCFGCISFVPYIHTLISTMVMRLFTRLALHGIHYVHHVQGLPYVWIKHARGCYFLYTECFRLDRLSQLVDVVRIVLALMASLFYIVTRLLQADYSFVSWRIPCSTDNYGGTASCIGGTTYERFACKLETIWGISLS